MAGAPLNVFGSAPKAVPFSEGGATGDDFDLSEHLGATVILTVVGVENVDTKLYGTKPAAKVSRIVSLSPEREPVVYEDVLLFQSAPASQLKRFAGQTITASVISYTNNYGGPFFKFGEPDAAGVALAEKFLAAESA